MVMSVIIKKTQLKSIGKSLKLRKKNEEFVVPQTVVESRFFVKIL